MNLRLAILNLLLPVTKWVGQIHAPYAHKVIRAVHYREGKSKLKRGSILVSHTNGELTNLFIPGFWSHIAIYTGNSRVVEAVGRGVVDTDLLDFMFTKDEILILNPLFASAEQMEAAADWAEDQIGEKYDFYMGGDGFGSKVPLSITKGEKPFYCSKLGYLAYEETMEKSPFVLRETWGVKTVTPQDFVNAATGPTPKFSLVWDSRKVVAYV